MYRTSSLYASHLYSIRCLYVSASGLTTFAVQPSSIASDYISCHLWEQELTVRQQPKSPSVTHLRCSKQYQSIGRRIPVLILAFRPQISRNTFFNGNQIKDTPVSDPFEAMHSDHFDIDLFKSISQQANACKVIAQCNEKEIMIEKRFRKFTGKNTLESFLHLQSTICKTLLKFCKNRSALPRPGPTSCSARDVNYLYIVHRRPVPGPFSTSTLSRKQRDSTLWKISTKIFTGFFTMTVHHRLSSAGFRYFLINVLHDREILPASFIACMPFSSTTL